MHTHTLSLLTREHTFGCVIVDCQPTSKCELINFFSLQFNGNRNAETFISKREKKALKWTPTVKYYVVDKILYLTAAAAAVTVVAIDQFCWNASMLKS